MELQPPQDAVCLRGREGLVERAPRVRREIVLDDPDALGFREVHVDELAQTLGIVLPRAPLGHARWVLIISPAINAERYGSHAASGWSELASAQIASE